MGEEVEDIRRVLTIAFRGTEGRSAQDLERTLSFDMEWVAPHEAEQAVKALQQAGWLKEEAGLLVPAVSVGDVTVPFGWFPRPRRLLEPVSASTMLAETTTPEKEKHGGKASVQSPQESKPASSAREVKNTGDPRAKLLQRVVRFVARQSGLDQQELQRRAERKQAAFDLMTPWLAYALVAREQGLEMNDIVEALAVV